MRTPNISLYTSGGDLAGPAYYRLYQYFDNSDYIINKRYQLPNKKYSKWMPISSKPIWFKVYAFIYMYIKRFFHLLKDCLNPPDILILSRGFLTRVMPFSYRLMLRYILFNGTKLIWDYDDNIISSKEISKKYFDWISSLACYIIVASKENISMLNPQYRSKAIVLPTTDKDMYLSFNDRLMKKRLESINKNIKLIWVGTAVSLPFVKEICPAIERFAESMKRKNKTVSLTIVCNKPLEYKSSSFELNNVKWTRTRAISEMINAHYGIMPLSDDYFNHFKGGFKLIQYLSIGLPVIGSAIGINNEIINSSFGFKPVALNNDQWFTALDSIPTSATEYEQFSHNAYNQWINKYSYEANRNKWHELINDLL